jgi:hypothetical protein
MHEHEMQLSAARGLLHQIHQRFEENQDFLLQYAKDTYEEVSDLTNDAIDALRLIEKHNFAKRATTFFLAHVFMPQSYGIHVDLLSGNLPMCFAELRLMVESLAKCFYADLQYPKNLFFKEKLARLETENITQIVRNVEEYTSINNGDFVALWQGLSREWIHAEGLVNRVVNYVSHHQDVPPWGLVIPMCYTESDILDLGELRQRIASFREISIMLLKNWPISG